MDILCFTPDETLTRDLVSVLTRLDCRVVVRSRIDEAILAVKQSRFKAILFYVEDIRQAQEQIATLRRGVREYVYVYLVAKDWPVEAAIELGANDVLSIDVTSKDAELALGNMNRLFDAIDYIGQQNIDFPSVGGVIGRSAFYQLFLSGIDRAARYGEQTYILFIALDNYKELYDIGGNYVTDYFVALLSQRLTSIRRQSDIIGQVDKACYALLLQRPAYEAEPLEAAQRFVKTLSEARDLVEGAPVPIRLKVSLLAVPSGSLLHESVLVLK
jgi:diguanylate cyclase (GGDEF)-like protein